jgi:hypothetical protein
VCSHTCLYPLILVSSFSITSWDFYQVLVCVFYFFLKFFFFFKGVMGLHSGLHSRQAFYHLSHFTSLFCVGYFWDMVLQTIFLGWPQTSVLLISASWVARSTDVSHCHLALIPSYCWTVSHGISTLQFVNHSPIEGYLDFFWFGCYEHFHTGF